MTALPVDRDPLHLHPTVRNALAGLLDVLHRKGLPFELFEGYRSPQRQNQLYAQGRSTPGPVVTHVRAGGSYHQYGLAVDLVLCPRPGGWSWGGDPRDWREMQRVGKTFGLVSLDFELPHLQLKGVSIRALKAGHCPEGADPAFLAFLQSHRS